MKLLPFLLLISGVCNGRTKDSTTMVLDLISKYGATVYVGGGSSIPTNPDTVRCVMVCIDTVNVEGLATTILFPNGNKLPSNAVYWQFGYVIKSKWDVWFNGYPPPAIYLDEKKRPLSKSIIVLISKEIL